MGTIYRAECKFRTVSLTPPISSYPPDVSDPATVEVGAGYFFVAADYTKNGWALLIFAQPSTFPAGTPTTNEWKTNAEVLWYNPSLPFPPDPLQPWTWNNYTVPVTWSDPDGNDGGTFLSGGLFAIDKDHDTDTITFTTPFGSVSRTLSETSALNTSPIFPTGIGHSINLGNTVPGVNTVFDVHAFDFYALKDGFKYFGHSLAAADPAPFAFPWTMYHFPGGAGGIADSNAQLTSDYLMEWAFTPGAYTPDISYFNWTATVGELPPPSNDIDMEQAHEHGIVWRGGPPWALATDLWVSRTFDNGNHWSTVTAFSDPTTTNYSPSLCWQQDGMLRLTWHNGSAIQEIYSPDLGVTWTMPTTVPFTGTWPRRIVNRDHGFALYFFINAANKLCCARTFDNGASFDIGPVVIDTNPIPGGAIDAEFMPDSTVVVSYYNGALWRQMRSRDFGRTWF